MTGIRLNYLRPEVRLERDRDEYPRAACAERLDLVEAMFEHGPETKVHRQARVELAVLCLGCPMRVTCEERAA